MKPTALLIGKTGQVGFELHRLLPTVANLIAPDRTDFDLLNAASIRRVINDCRPQLVINAAAYTAVDAAERDQATAHAINADAVALIAEETRKIGGVLIHYSTDYVFDGEKRAPYSEGDVPNPINAYGKTKLAGEQQIRASGVPHIILRTSWVYATRGRNFLLTILRLATQQEQLRVVADQVGAPTCATDLAAVTLNIVPTVLSRPAPADLSRISGTYHASAAGETTWHQFAEAILAQARNAPQTLPWLTHATQGRPLTARKIIPVSTKEYGSPTPRPLYSALSNTRLRETFGLALPTWRDQLGALFRAHS